ncbi:hypothetical protein HXX01_02750 [Candidatus Nomurabacteria bacterium]|nr:hypothetical protein [Candidatus Nomurabacteria bacterium]
MKIFNQIIIVILFIATIFIVKSDYKSIYSKALSYLENGVTLSSGLYKDGIQNVTDSINNSTNYYNNEGSNDVTKAVETPGALVVSDNFLTNNISKINLSSKNVINITNEQRKLNGNLPPLVENSKLDFSAEKKLQDMFVKGYFEHVSPSGVGVGDLGAEVGYEYIIIGENLALGNFVNDKALVDAWMASPGHRANILNKRYTEIGVSVGKGIYNGKDVWMSVQHFGLPKSACPAIDEVLRGVIGFDQNKIKDMEGELASKKAKIDSGAVSEGMTTNGQIDSYNSLVKDYNNLIVEIKEKINNYNEQVRNFNNCIQSAE